MKPVRVVVVDQSLAIRAVLRRSVGSGRGLEVVGEAEDGPNAVDVTSRLRPDAVVMDLDLPGSKGRSTIQAIQERHPTPVVLVTAVRPDSIRAAFRSMNHGVVAVLPKPEVPEEWHPFGKTLRETLREVGGARRRSKRRTKASPSLAPRGLRYVAVGASTGGPAALCEMLDELGSEFGAGIAVVQHIADGFELGLAEWLDRSVAIEVSVAADGDELRPGTARIAPAGHHLRIDPGGIVRLASGPRRRGHRPSIDVLFRSLKKLPSASVAAVLLSGMGKDGAAGMSDLRGGGALTIAQDEASCAVYGMPRAAAERDAADHLLPPQRIGRLLLRAVGAADG